MAEEKTKTEKPIKKTVVKAKKYTEAIGRRKTATARVRLVESTKNNFVINERELKDFFGTEELIKIVQDPILKSKTTSMYEVSAHVNGGGTHAQAEAIRHGVSRALIIIDIEHRDKLKKLGFLKRDPRAKERRKFGLKKARKAPQWSKR